MNKYILIRINSNSNKKQLMDAINTFRSGFTEIKETNTRTIREITETIQSLVVCIPVAIRMDSILYSFHIIII